MEAKQTPLIDLLNSVPYTARCRIDEPDGMGSVFFAVGRLCHETATELDRLHKETFTLAAAQCPNITGDDGGTPRCAELLRLQAARERDNMAFKQLISQRGALLDALRRVMRHIPAYAGGASLSDDMKRARAAIAQAEE